MNLLLGIFVSLGLIVTLAVNARRKARNDRSHLGKLLQFDASTTELIRSSATGWEETRSAEPVVLPTWTVVSMYMNGRDLKGAMESLREDMEDGRIVASRSTGRFVDALYEQFAENHVKLSKLLLRCLRRDFYAGAAACWCYRRDVHLVQVTAECLEDERDFQMLEEHV